MSSILHEGEMKSNTILPPRHPSIVRCALIADSYMEHPSSVRNVLRCPNRSAVARSPRLSSTCCAPPRPPAVFSSFQVLIMHTYFLTSPSFTSFGSLCQDRHSHGRSKSPTVAFLGTIVMAGEICTNKPSPKFPTSGRVKRIIRK